MSGHFSTHGMRTGEWAYMQRCRAHSMQAAQYKLAHTTQGATEYGPYSKAGSINPVLFKAKGMEAHRWVQQQL